MGAAIMKTCFAGEPFETPHRHHQHMSHHDARRRYEQQCTRSLAKTMPPSATAVTPHARRVDRRSAAGLESPDKELLAKKYAARRALDLPQTAVHLQKLGHDVAKSRKSPASSVSSEAATMSESSFVADSPSHAISPVRRSSPTAAGFRALLPSQYVLECVAGKGTTSTCYKCKRKTDGRRFACKIIEKRKLAPSARKRMEVAAQLRREVDVLRRVDHPHIAKLEQSFEDDNYLILIMELMEGGELFDAIVDKGRFSEREAVHVARCILSAIQHMHERGVVHRDLKPENMLLAVSTRRGRRQDAANPLNIKIIDFGFAKILKEGATSTSFLGTGGYLAPEILLRQPYGTSVDMWSFGVLTYLLLCGRLPFAATTQLRPNQKIQSLYKLTFPKRYWRGVSPVAIDFLQRVLVLNPSARLTATEALNHPWLRC
ncbi:CAMK protein kinase [Phytophthora nicotianae P10297]|uniref:CAMK protein kinase n=7 Tax=Phytophthora nicotianae TaxID=4792 RepID=W2Q5T6_PHYN3|nr:CAMK protein kinase [Phytophthora nicotianae INRA-310]ETI46256.1 CAMK protein kinase [Phytophthora nicotianae P1569]ETL92742.1 CAMK protein kinase [Phytophthora nicotianae]ETO74933.1 CAMK protein kinase [Phytophthora nicotianae P1976]ETP44120.1 CAMK protein kinase [Phytophthora nicotianae P10297]ETN08502.1 CAMK protein kinase [Phytophthora nicotianae INRA-310]